ncbi:MAG: 6-bladed beta-propeller [Chloroherpetonaceae bacterium]|nr:6-bladed beta-propeller [Chloroherpetonaceae bacterium]
MKRYIVIIFCLIVSCKENKSKHNISLTNTNKIILNEKERKIGSLASVLISKNEEVFLLDESASTVNVYSTEGKLLNVYGKKGSGPCEIEEASEFCIDSINNRLIVVEGGKGLKIIPLNSKKEDSKSIFIKDDGFMVVHGYISIDKNGNLILTSFWNPKDINTNLIVINEDGIVLSKFNFLPSGYEKFGFGKENWHDCNEKNEFVVTFLKSPSLFVGNLETGIVNEYSFENLKEKYISEKRKSKMSLKESIKINREERMNYTVRFVNDTIIARATHISTEASSKNRSFVQRAEQRVEFITTKGEYLGETLINGVLRCIYNGQLVIEESDEPDNRILGFYRVKITEK